jgi:hypothetical protein
MRCFAYLILLVTIFLSCSKKKEPPRTNFAELTLDGRKFSFNVLEAIYDTSSQGSDQGVYGNYRFYSSTSSTTGSSLDFEIASTSKWLNATYEFPGELFPGKSIVFLHLQTYIDRVPGTYSLQNNTFTITIDSFENGRIHGTFSGKLFCYTSIPYGLIAKVTNGEFELPYSYR